MNYRKILCFFGIHKKSKSHRCESCDFTDGDFTKIDPNFPTFRGYTRRELFKVWLLDIFGLCHYCYTKKAVWSLMSGIENACDDCVPRGCSCNREPIDGNPDNMCLSNWIEDVDSKGRKYPCCEWARKYPFCELSYLKGDE